MMKNDRKEWLGVRVFVTPETSELVSAFLFDAGAQGVEDKNEVLEAFFLPDTVEKTIERPLKMYLNSLEEMGLETFPEKVIFYRIAERDWNSEWKKIYHPLRISDKIMIKPSWEKVPKDAPECVVEIDPEMAFGTGTHETTKLTLQLLEKNLKGGEKVLDVGTGTGILSIAAAKLGAEQIIAFDIDPLATETAQRNIEINKVDNIDIFTGTLDAVTGTHFDIIVANVNRTQIIKLLPDMVKMLGKSSKLILSGIMDKEEDMLKEAIRINKLTENVMLAEGEWIAFEVTRPVI